LYRNHICETVNFIECSHYLKLFMKIII